MTGMSLPDKKISQLKAEIRKKISVLILSESTRRSRSKKISAQIQKTQFFKNADSIGFYFALADEIDILPAAKLALSQGKKVFFPRMTGKRIEFRQITDFEKQFEVGRFSVLEPAVKKTQSRIQALDLVIIPGRAFDKQGRRLGRGGGHYDRLLEKWEESVRMGVAFREQMVDQVPFELHDIDMDVVLTA